MRSHYGTPILIITWQLSICRLVNILKTSIQSLTHTVTYSYSHLLMTHKLKQIDEKTFLQEAKASELLENLKYHFLTTTCRVVFLAGWNLQPHNLLPGSRELNNYINKYKTWITPDSHHHHNILSRRTNDAGKDKMRVWKIM